MDYCEKFLVDHERDMKRAKSKLHQVFEQAETKTIDLFKDPNGLYKFNWQTKPTFFDSNIKLARWYHFQWFLNLQVKIFGKVIC